MPHFKCKQNILTKWKQSLLSKNQAQRAWLMFKSYIFLCELLSKSRIHESKSKPWFTLRALGEYIWQKDLKFWSSSFKNMASEINYFHYIAASELELFLLNFCRVCNTAVSSLTAPRNNHLLVPNPLWLRFVPTAVSLLALFFFL